MKIKKTRHVRLDELLKYVWDNDINDIEFHSDNDSWVRIDDYGDLTKVYEVESTDLFPITEEVEIDEDTKLYLVEMYHFGHQDYNTITHFNESISHILSSKNNNIEVLYIYLLNPDGSIGELIWSKERGLID